MVRANLNLVVALRRRGMSQKILAELVGQHPSVVSRVVSGVYNLDEEQERLYAEVLGMRREDLFENSQKGRDCHGEQNWHMAEELIKAHPAGNPEF